MFNWFKKKDTPKESKKRPRYRIIEVMDGRFAIQFPDYAWSSWDSDYVFWRIESYKYYGSREEAEQALRDREEANRQDKLRREKFEREATYIY